MELLFILIGLLCFWLFKQLGTEQPNTFFRNLFQTNITPATFELNLLSLCALVIRANGQITQAELDFVRFEFVRLYGKERANVIFRSFNQLAKEHQISTQRVATFVRVRTPYETRLQIIYFLFGIAKSDGHISQEEINQIANIAFYFRIAKTDFESIKAMFFSAGSEQTAQKASTPHKAYTILGIGVDATDAEVKQAYRSMAKKYHPDRVVSTDPAIKKGAEEKFRQVQEAYEEILKSRKLVN